MKKLCCVLCVGYVLLLIAVGCSKRKETPDSKQALPIDLMTVVPDDVLGFVAISGGDNLKPAFEASALGRLWNDPELQTFYQTLSGQLLEKLRQNVPSVREGGTVDTVLDLARLAANRPVILGAAKRTDHIVPVYGFAILDAGSKKAEISAAIDKVEALLPRNRIAQTAVGSLTMHCFKADTDVIAYWGWVENYFVLAVNDAEGLAFNYIQKPRAEAHAHLRQGPTANDVFSTFIDCKGIGEIIRNAAEQDGSAHELARITTVIETLGLSEIASIASRMGFVGSEVVSTRFVEISKRRKGLLTCLKPIDNRMFGYVDSQAGRVIAFNLDLGGMYDAIMEAIKISVSTSDYANIQLDIAQVEAQIDFRIRHGLLESLAGPMVLYSIPAGAVVEAPTGGIVAVVKLADAKLIEKALLAGGELAEAKSDGAVQVNSRPQDDGTTLHTWVAAPLAMMQMLPCWTVTNDRLVIASNPALHELAMAAGKAPRQSIRSVEGYKKATARLPKKPVYFSYTDAKSQFRQMVFVYHQYWPMVKMFAAQAQLDLPPMLPTLFEFEKTLDYSHQYAWFDSTGFHSYARGPGVEISLESIGVTSLGMGILMPALARVRQIAYRLYSGTNLAAIGKACSVHAHKYGGRLPLSLETLVDSVDLPRKCLESKSKPKDFDGPSFVYVPGQTVDMDPANVVAYENPAFLSEGTNVLYLDGHAAFVKPDEFLRDLEATYKRLGKEMPEVKFKEETSSSLLPF